MNLDRVSPFPAPVAPSTEEVDGKNSISALQLELEGCRRRLAEHQQSEDRLRRIIDEIPALVWSHNSNDPEVFQNKAYLEYLGISVEEARGSGWQKSIHPDDVGQYVEKWLEIAASGAPGEAEARFLRFDGEYRWFLMRCVPVRNELGEIIQWYGTNTDIDDRKRAEALLEREKRLLEMIARGQSLGEIFEGLCRVVEEVSGDCLAGIMLLDLDGRRLRTGAAPSFPADFIAAVDGVEIGPSVGSCGTAIHRKEQVIVCDIAADPLWADYRELALKYGLRAAWSTPIVDSQDLILGTFAIYWREPRSPNEQHLQIISQITHLAAVAIERRRAIEALCASEKLARGQAEALTSALEAMAKESDPDRFIEHVMRTVTAQLDGHSSSVWLRDEASGLMVFEFALEEGVFKTKSETTIAAVSPSLPVQAIHPWREMFRTRQPYVLEDVRTGPDFPWRNRVIAQGVVTILIVPMIVAGKVEGGFGYRFTQKRTFSAEEMELPRALANLAMLAIHLARLSAQSRKAAVIGERNRLARDIHDTLAQGFTGVILHLEAAEEAMSRQRPEVVSRHLRGAGETAREGLREARRSVQALRPLALEDKKLGEALKELIDKMTAGTAVRAEFNLQGEARELAPEWEANILRIGQEVLTNVLRHARASQFHALLAFDDREVRLCLHDNGRGFDSTKKHDGFGLQGMRERVESMGGQLSLQSPARQGTTISMTLPLPPAPDFIVHE